MPLPLLAAVIGALLAFGCPEPGPELEGDAGIDAGIDATGGPTTDCEDVECEEGLLCHQGRCYETCDSTADCPENHRCHQDRCIPVDCAHVGCLDDQTCWRGACYPACDRDADCADPEHCTKEACVAPCETVDCPTGQTCYRGACYETCDAQHPCEGDDRCVDGRCTPNDCESVDCRDDETCYRGVCHPACDEAEDCEEGHTSCIEDACIDEPCDGVQCPAGHTCYRGVCYESCSGEADCDDDHRCWDEHHCAPDDCAGVDCDPGHTCYRGVCYETCDEDADCDDENACIDQACADPCETVDCSDDQTCYRGVCYDSCDEDADCDDDNRCDDQTCLPVDCAGVECLDYETCYYGVCYETCDEDADCGDGADCDQSACVPECIGDDGGDQTCPTLDFSTLEAEDVTVTAATLHGRIDELPQALPPDHGLCWDTDQQPVVAEADCASLGVATTQGEFSHQVDGLAPGTTHYVRAYAEDDSGNVDYANQISFATGASAPQQLEATDGSYTDRVELTWQGVDGAADYVVYRNGDEIATVDGATTSYDDEEADAPPPPLAPEILSVTDGDRTDGIEITWEAAETPPGKFHDYEVTALAPDGTESPPAGDSGYRGAPDIQDYELCAGGADDCDDDDWQIVDTDDGLKYLDTGAPTGSVVAGDVTATQGAYRDFVRLVADDFTIEQPDEQLYQVRAISPAGTGAPSDENDGWGRRATGDLHYEWFGSQPDTDEFVSLVGPDTMADVHEDETAPEDGSERDYRLEITAPGAAPWSSTDTTTGWIAVLDLKFDTEPADPLTAGEAFEAAVQLVNRDGEPMEIEAKPVTVALNQNTFADDTTEATVETDDQGTAKFELTIETANTDYVLTATSDDDDLEDASAISSDFDVEAGSAVATNSWISGEDGAVADGTDTAEIEIELRDEFDNPVIDAIPEFIAIPEDGNDYEPCEPTDDAGVADCAMSSTESGEKTLEITDPVEKTGETIEFYTFDCDPDGDPFGGGDGTSDEPWMLCSPDHLNEIGTDDQYLDGHFAVARSIDMSGLEYNVIGDDSSQFVGTFDGNHMSIEHLTIDAPAGWYKGMFAHIGTDGVVEDVILEEFDIAVPDTVGALAGENNGTIRRCGVQGTLEGGDGMLQGGLVGHNDGGTIEQSYAVGSITVDDGAYVGGLTERNANNGSIEDSYAIVDISLESGQLTEAGGLVADNSASPDHTYAAGALPADEDAGGLVGIGGYDEVTEDSYWDVDTTGTSSSADGSPLDNPDFQYESSFDGWDFDDTWVVETAHDGFERPILRWQLE